jgi:hypothetical protein
MSDTRQHTHAPLCGDHRDSVSDDRTEVKSCYRTTKHTRPCNICFHMEKQMHMPIGYVGRFCGKCCPACAAHPDGGQFWTEEQLQDRAGATAYYRRDRGKVA